jgi:hypothetical protein
MRQTLHIFRKDVRYLRREIILLIALCAIFVWRATGGFDREEWSDPALMLAAAFLIIRVIHAEAIPGDTQFWITRPYRWGSLLAAKVLFIIVAVNVPIFVARFLILVLAGFPVIPNLPGLLWSQCFLMVISFLPVAAVASLTSGLGQFVFSALIVLAVLESGIASRWIPETPGRWVADEWLESVIAAAFLLAVASFVLAVQYRNRRTSFSRLFAIGAGLTGFALVTNIPISLQLNAESRLATQPSESIPIQLAIDPSLKRISKPSPKSGRVQIVVPFHLSGVQEGREVRMDAIEIAIEGAGGVTRTAGMNGVDGGRFIDNIYVANLYIFLDDPFFEGAREQPVNIRASTYLTMFGGGKEETYALRSEPINVTDSLQCFITGDFVHFRTAFRMPAQLITARIGTLFTADIARISYSPLPAGPAEMTLNPLREFSFGPPAAGSDITIIRKDVLAHFRRDVELKGVRLADFAR